MSGIRYDQRRKRRDGRSCATRAERKAEARRARALSHLQRVRGQLPSRTPRNALFAAAAALSLAAGATSGVSLARGAGWFGRDAQLESISVRGASHLAAADVAVATGVSRNAALSVVEPVSVAKRLEDNAWIAEANALRLPTGTLLVDVTEMVPVALVDAGTPARTWVVDAGGTPFAVAEERHEAELPRIVTAGAVAPNEPNEEVARAVRLAHALPRFGLMQPVEISVAAEGDPEGFALRLAGLATRIVLGREDLDAKLQKLARLLASDVPEIGDVRELDLRFADQAVLRNEPSPEGAAQAAASRGRATPPI
jgi:cell division septal protein FtsQ